MHLLHSSSRNIICSVCYFNILLWLRWTCKHIVVTNDALFYIFIYLFIYFSLRIRFFSLETSVIKLKLTQCTEWSQFVVNYTFSSNLTYCVEGFILSNIK